MKHFWKLCSILLLTLFVCSAKGQTVDKIALYLPNRVLDLMDVFTLNLGLGPSAKTEIRLTRAFQLGGGISDNFKLFKAVNRQYGYAIQNGWSLGAGPFWMEDTECKGNSSLVREYLEVYRGVPSPSQNIYDIRKGARDYWEIGTSVGFLAVETDAGIHPVELLDAVLGFFFIDIKNDDLTFEDLK